MDKLAYWLGEIIPFMFGLVGANYFKDFFADEDIVYLMGYLMLVVIAVMAIELYRSVFRQK